MNPTTTDEFATSSHAASEEPKITVSDDRLRALYLYQMLLQYTDEDHSLTTKQIQQMFEERYQIKIHRTVVPEYINLLRVAGVDVVGQRRRSFHYYLAYREFSIPEIKILIDAVQSSKFITEKKSRDLVEKLTHMTCQANADQLKRSTHISGRAKSENEKGYYIVDSINTAIINKKKISFTAFDFDLVKNQVPKNDGKPYTVSPYDLIWDGDFYYMTGFCDERLEMRTFRLDRLISVPEVLDEEAIAKPEDYSVEHYTRETFRMYSSNIPTEVTLLCENRAMNAIVDQFGIDIEVTEAGPEHFRVTSNVCPGPTFYRWIFGWGGQIRIESPAWIREEYRQSLLEALSYLGDGAAGSSN